MNLETLKALDHALLAMAGYNSALTIGDTARVGCNNRRALHHF